MEHRPRFQGRVTAPTRVVTDARLRRRRLRAIPDCEMVVWATCVAPSATAAPRPTPRARRAPQRPVDWVSTATGADLENWECGQDRVVVLMHNRPEHVESILGCWRARDPLQRQLPVHRRRDRRAVPHARHAWRGLRVRGLAALLRDSLDLGGGSTCSWSSTTAATLVDATAPVLTSRRSSPPGGHVEARTSPDDIYIACTGGHDGLPRRRALAPGRTCPSQHREGRRPTRQRSRPRRGRRRPVRVSGRSPLMHVAAQWTVLRPASAPPSCCTTTAALRRRTILATAARANAPT